MTVFKTAILFVVLKENFKVSRKEFWILIVISVFKAITSFFLNSYIYRSFGDVIGRSQNSVSQIPFWPCPSINYYVSMYANRKVGCALFCVITFFLADDELIVLVLVQVAAFMVEVERPWSSSCSEKKREFSISWGNNEVHYL